MYRITRLAIVMLVGCTCFAHPQRIGTIGSVHYPFMKIEDGFFVSWQPKSHESAVDQIEIFSNNQLVGRANPLRAVPDAASIGIYDVAVRKDKIAVAAVFVSKAGNRRVSPAAALLVFEFSGRLLSAYALAPSRQIYLLTMDDESNIWTVTAHAGGKDPAHTPMAVEYSQEGKVLRQVFTRSMFPPHATSMLASPDLGIARIGFEAGVVWFWLPVSTDLVTISVADGTAKITKTGLPKTAGKREVPLTAVRDSSGDVITEFREDSTDGGYDLAYYAWSPATKSWSEFHPGSCEGIRLVGTFGDEQLYAQSRSQSELGTYDICSFQAK